MWAVNIRECSVIIDRLSAKEIEAIKAAIGGRKTDNDILVGQIQNEHHYARKARPLYENKVSSKKGNQPSSSSYNFGPTKSSCVNCDTSDKDDDDFLVELITDMEY